MVSNFELAFVMPKSKIKKAGEAFCNSVKGTEDFTENRIFCNYTDYPDRMVICADNILKDETSAAKLRRGVDEVLNIFFGKEEESNG